MNKIATWGYIHELTGESHGENSAKCPYYYDLLMKINLDGQYKGLTISGSYQQVQLIQESSLNYIKPTLYNIQVTFTPTVTLTKINVPSVCSGNFGTVPTSSRVHLAGLTSSNTLNAYTQYKYLITGEGQYNMTTRPSSAIVCSDSGGSVTQVSLSSTVYLGFIYGDSNQRYWTPGTLTVVEK